MPSNMFHPLRLATLTLCVDKDLYARHQPASTSTSSDIFKNGFNSVVHEVLSAFLPFARSKKEPLLNINAKETRFDVRIFSASLITPWY